MAPSRPERSCGAHRGPRRHPDGTGADSRSDHRGLRKQADDDPHVTAKIALAHLNEFPDYYTRLERMEEEAKRDWAMKAGY